MSDLNRVLTTIQSKSSKMRDEIISLLKTYDNLYQDSNRTYLAERAASESDKGLEDFFMLIQVIRRNRDVIGSLARGFGSLRPLDKYKFVEEDLETIKKTTKPKKKIKETIRETPSLEEIEHSEVTDNG